MGFLQWRVEATELEGSNDPRSPGGREGPMCSKGKGASSHCPSPHPPTPALGPCPIQPSSLNLLGLWPREGSDTGGWSGPGQPFWGPRVLLREAQRAGAHVRLAVPSAGGGSHPLICGLGGPMEGHE